MPAPQASAPYIRFDNCYVICVVDSRNSLNHTWFKYVMPNALKKHTSSIAELNDTDLADSLVLDPDMGGFSPGFTGSSVPENFLHGALELSDSPVWNTGNFASVAATQAAPAALVSTTEAPAGSDAEIGFMSGVTSNATVAGTSFWTWQGNTPPSYSSTTSDSVKWGSPTVSATGTPGGNVTYWFDAGSNWTGTEQAALTSGLMLWSAEANISFSLAASASTANFTFDRGTDGGAYQAFASQTIARVGSSTDGTPSSTGAIISIDTSVGGFGPIGGAFSLYGGYPYETFIHEEGHMIGLGHGGPYNGSVDPGTQQFSPYDTRLWTLMSYIDPWMTTAKYYNSYPVTGTNWGISPDGYYYEPTTPMMLDILAAQRIYGSATAGPLASGGQTFGFNCNLSGPIEQYFDFTINAHPVVTIWDGGSNNTLDLSGYSANATISLAPGTFSSCDGAVNNIGIAEGTWIQTAIGGSGNDVITGNGLNNVLRGGGGTDTITGAAGNDTIDGGPGTDTAVWSGNHTDYSFTYNSTTAAFTVTDLRSGSPDGTDTVTNVENFRFADGTFSSSAFLTPIWHQIDNNGSPFAISAGDFSGTGTAELVASYKGYGTYTYSSGVWTKIDPDTPDLMTAGHFSGTGSQLVGVFGGYGTYYWSNASGWEKIDPDAPDVLTTGDFTGAGHDQLAAVFAGYGTYTWTAGNGWTKIDSNTPGLMASGDFAGLGHAQLAAVYSGYGIYTWSAGGVWNRIDNDTPTQITAGDFYNNGKTQLAAYYTGYGTYIWDANSGWAKIDSGAIGGMASVDLNGDGRGELLAYLPNQGVYEWLQGSGWSKYDNTGALPTNAQHALFATGNFQGGAIIDAAVTFPDQAGVWLDPPPALHASSVGSPEALARLGALHGP